jgi:4-amino-4-deoxy-L-arabinose transferase-like glycosyltransferase
MRDFALLRRMRLGAGLAMLLAVAAPWFILVSLRNPGFAEFFFIHEHVARYMTEVHHRAGAWWYYIPLLLIGMLPWTSALPWIARRDRPVAAAASDTRAVRILVAWCGFVLVFFSLSGSKLPSYILPMFPALALLVALKLRGAEYPHCVDTCWCRHRLDHGLDRVDTGLSPRLQYAKRRGGDSRLRPRRGRGAVSVLRWRTVALLGARSRRRC